ncbi:cell division protein FtsQ [Alkalispirochaeta americana]|uniref:Cell division protein FtsQ n=1 Tax=Alkalispirochaeta americana TaxID=159291 RepID=A0A1N6PK21_9SPIO|nr:FtsQ-type POTRA domain-containing protein [Alkalispirochaeta americana]SIQ04748.1 cell division protein FtsQ [Alkalispirochaeta americana]
MSEAASFRRNRSTASPAPRRMPAGGNRWRVLWGLAVTGALLLGGLLVVQGSWLKITRIHVHADFDMSREEVLHQAGITGGMNYFLLRPAEVVARLKRNPLIREARAEKIFPNALRLDLVRRRPLVLTIFSRGDRDVLAAVDREGVIFDAGQHLGGANLPVFSGITFQGVPVGSRMPRMLEQLLEDLHRLRLEEPKLFERISELRVVPRNNGGVDILLFTADYRIPVRIGDRISPELCRWILVVLDILSQQETADQVAEVDFRSGEVVYRMKEGARGR